MDHGEARVHQHLLEQFHIPLVFPSEHLPLLAFKHPDGLLCPSQQHGGQGSSEDEACGVGAHCVHQGGGAGNVATHTAECLTWSAEQVSKRHICS